MSGFHDKNPLVPSGLAQDVIFKYTCGCCFILASELHRLYKYKLIHMDSNATHVGVLLDRNTILDVDGIWNRKDWVNYYSRFGCSESTVIVDRDDHRNDYYAFNTEIHRENDCPEVRDLAKQLKKIVDAEYYKVKGRK